MKAPIPNGLQSCVVYKFSCAGCAACYVGETTLHFNTRLREHLETDRASHIFKHLESSLACRSACSRDNFAIIDQASSRFALKIKEASHIFWDKPTLNTQVKQVNLKLFGLILNDYCHSLKYCYYYCNFCSIYISL